MPRIVRIFAAAAVLLAVLALAACSGATRGTTPVGTVPPPSGSSTASEPAGSKNANNPQPPAGAPSMTGTVESVTKGETATAILVVGDKGSKIAKAVAVYDDFNTLLIAKEKDGTTAMVPIATLKKGDKIQTWLEQPKAGSNPPQASAAAIVILK